MESRAITDTPRINGNSLTIFFEKLSKIELYTRYIHAFLDLSRREKRFGTLLNLYTGFLLVRNQRTKHFTKASAHMRAISKPDSSR